MNNPAPGGSPAPETWLPARRLVRELLRPVERFLRIEASSGILLLVASFLALGWVNSPWGASYERFWHTVVALRVGDWTASADLHFLVNDALMVLFFFSVGLEIRREMHEGELADARRAALPIVAAIGGMAAPALLFWLCNRGLPSQGGWGVPTATDIAFAVGALALLGKRVPPALRILLLALAIIDDIGAILIIALFYSSGVSLGGLAVAAVGVAGVLIWQRIEVRNPWAYVLPGFVVWLGCLRGGVHPTLAGVVLGLLTPVRPWLGERGFLEVAGRATGEFRHHAERDDHRAEDLLGPLGQVELARREAVSPLVRLQTALHPWVAFVIMPLFALANAGVSLRGVRLDAPDLSPVVAGVMLGLVVGKPLGIVLVSFVSVRAGLCALPAGVGWRGVALVGSVAGIGFTMALFVAGLAFQEPMLGTAKLAVLMASGVAGALALALGRWVLPAQPEAGAATSLVEAETSTEK